MPLMKFATDSGDDYSVMLRSFLHFFLDLAISCGAPRRLLSGSSIVALAEPSQVMALLVTIRAAATSFEVASSRLPGVAAAGWHVAGRPAGPLRSSMPIRPCWRLLSCVVSAGSATVATRRWGIVLSLGVPGGASRLAAFPLRLAVTLGLWRAPDRVGSSP